jgi:chromate transporter
VTPGPVFTTATFIGFVVGSKDGMEQASLGAVLATLGIFLPAFVFVALSGPLVKRVRNSPAARAFLDGVNVASLALMGVVLVQLGMGTLKDVPRIVLALASGVVLLFTKVNSAWLMLGAAGLGLLLAAFGWI